MLLWFRSNLHILILDLARAYQALKTGTMEKFTWLFLCQHPWVRVGDVGSIEHTSKYGKRTWQACTVLALLPDRKGVVRSVTIGVRRRDGLRDRKAKYHARPLSEMNIGVQRLA